VNISGLYQSEPNLNAMPLSLSMARHRHYLADEFTNLSIIKLLLYLPEWDPIEQVWQSLRHNELADRCVEGHEEIMKKSWSNVVEHGIALSAIAKGLPVYVLEIGLKWEINYGDWYNPYTYLVDVLQRVGIHPGKDVFNLVPRVWKTKFADNPLQSDLSISTSR
jgi:hypothetical protein